VTDVKPALLIKTWRDHWRGLIAWCLGLVVITAIELSVFPSFHEAAAEMDAILANWPDVFQGMFSLEDYGTGPGFLNVELFSMIVPLVFVALGVSWGAGATADEERNGTADILLVLPVTRTAVIVTKMVAAIGVLLLVAFALAVTIALGGPLVEIDIAFGTVLMACLSGALLGFVFGSIAFFVGAVTGKRAVAMGVAIGLALGSFLVKSLSASVNTFDAVNPYNPSQWAMQGNPLASAVPASSLGWLALVSVAFLTAAVIAFNRRDISA
jgi:ABC-2 type transport system permease protein